MGIKEARMKAGISRAEMSRAFNMPIRTLENWESGKNKTPIWVEEMIIEKLESGNFCIGGKNMKIKGIGVVSKKEILSIFTDGEKDIEDGVITWEEAAREYKIHQIEKESKIGCFTDAFGKNFARVPKEAIETLSPKLIASIVDALYDSYSDGKENR